MKHRDPRHFVPLAALLAVTSCAKPSLDRTPSEPPEQGFEFYTGGDDDAGDLLLGFTTYTHAETGRTCILLPVYHVAEAGFFAEVQREMDAADVVLTEGVAGAPSLSPALPFTAYVFANYRRLASFTGLAHQGEVITWRPNQRNADLRLAEFQASWPWTTPIGQAVALPAIALVWEPTVLLSWLERAGRTLVGSRAAFRAGWRHWLVSDANERDDEDGVLVPGVISTRNVRLLEVLDEVAADDAVRRIAIPWGAAHFPPLRDDLEARGWAESEHRWVRAIAVRELLGEPGSDETAGFDLFLPWVMQVRALAPSWNLSLLFHSIAIERRPDEVTSVELLWELLLSLRRNPPGGELDLQVLPSLFGRPLLFEYVGTPDDSRLRFLWFFEV